MYCIHTTAIRIAATIFYSGPGIREWVITWHGGVPRDVLKDGNIADIENRSVFKECADRLTVKGSAAKVVEHEHEAQPEAQLRCLIS